jgi:hypothetical protein
LHGVTVGGFLLRLFKIPQTSSTRLDISTGGSKYLR